MSNDYDKNKLHKKIFHEQTVLKIYHILCQPNFHLTRVSLPQL